MVSEQETYETLISNKFSYRKADGTVVEWQQEDEHAATTKAEALGMLQRTVDFWIPYITVQLRRKQKLSKKNAEIRARQVLREQMTQLVSQPFPQKWGITFEDLTFPT